MPKKVIFTPEQIEKIISSYKSDISILDISLMLKVSITPIKKLLKDYKIFKPVGLRNIKFKYIDEILNKSKFLDIYNKFNNLQEMANYFECGIDLIKSYIKIHDIVIRRPWDRKNDRILKLSKAIITDYVVNHIPIYTLTKKYKIGKTSIKRLFTANNIEIKNSHEMQLPKNFKTIKNDKDLLLKIRNECGNITQVAKQLNCGRDTATKLFKDNNIPAYTHAEFHATRHMLNFSKYYPEYTLITRNEKYFSFLHSVCNKKFNVQMQRLSQRIKQNTCISLCPHCFHRKSVSSNEIQIRQFIETLLPYTELILQSKQIIKGKELDIYIPSLSLAIEYCGLYWHSEELGKYKTYHKEKYDMCKEKGIRLITIFEDEWLNKSEIVKSKLMHILKQSNTKIYARKCVIREILPSEKNSFLDKYHIQGHDNSKIKLGIFNNDILIGVCTFSKPNISKGKHNNIKNGFELSRYATSVHIVGGLGKCLKYFITKYSPTYIETFADLRWSDGNLYQQLGFKLTHVTPPNYWYIPERAVYRYHRFNFRKNILLKKYPTIDKSKTEFQIMQELGYKKIWDCGNIKYILNLHS